MWTIEFHPNAREELMDLSEQAQEKITTALDKIALFGFDALAPKMLKHLQGKIWELRTTSRDGIARSLYATMEGQTVKILVVFVKKTEKTPNNMIELAEKRRDK